MPENLTKDFIFVGKFEGEDKRVNISFGNF